MNDLKSAVGQPLWDKVTAEFGEFVRADLFELRYANVSPRARVGFKSIADLIVEMTKAKPSIPGSKRLKFDLGTPLSSIRNIEISKLGKKRTH